MRELLVLLAATVQRATIALCQRADLPWYQLTSRERGPWCLTRDDYTDRATCLLASGRIEDVPLASVSRVGRLVIAREWAPDGGGTTLILDASEELKGAGADTLRVWLEAQRERDERDLQACIDRAGEVSL